MLFGTIEEEVEAKHSELAADGSSIELAKRPRGRPPGSKNKPRPPITIALESLPSSAMRPHILDIPDGHDVLASLLAFSRRMNLALCVLSAAGQVSNLTLRQPPHTPASPEGTVAFRGRFQILSLTLTPAAAVTVAGPQGQVLGGTVVGTMAAAGTVTVLAAAFERPKVCRLPLDDGVAKAESVEMQRHELQRATVESCGMGSYTSFFPATEAIWAPAARAPFPLYRTDLI